MIQKWVVGMAISFVMRQIGKWGSSIDWAKVKADVAERVKALVPGEWFDAEAVAAVMALLDVAEKVLAATGELEKIIQMIVDGKMQEAWAALRQLILDAWQPETPAEQMAYDCVKGCEVL
jgi:hypothetical protein